jgi:hypothetical protein
MEQFKDRKLKELAEKMQCTEKHDLKGFFEMMQKMSPEEKEMLVNDLKNVQIQLGNMALDRAFTDGTMTELEWLKMQKEQNLTVECMGDVLTYYYHKKIMQKQNPNEQLIMLTAKGSPIDINRVFLKNRFGLEVTTAEEFMGVENNAKT